MSGLGGYLKLVTEAEWFPGVRSPEGGKRSGSVACLLGLPLGTPYPDRTHYRRSPHPALSGPILSSSCTVRPYPLIVLHCPALSSHCMALRSCMYRLNNSESWKVKYLSFLSFLCKCYDNTAPWLTRTRWHASFRHVLGLRKRPRKILPDVCLPLL